MCIRDRIKPKKLKPGDKVATISLSWGGAGDLPHRYEMGKQRLQNEFGLEVVETKHALKPPTGFIKTQKLEQKI